MNGRFNSYNTKKRYNAIYESYMNERDELEVGEIYVIELLNSPRRKDPSHWHNSYYIPIKERSDHLELYIINKGVTPKFATTETIKNKFYSKVTNKPGVDHGVIRKIFE